MYGYGWEVAAGIDVFEGHALWLAILEKLDSTALQYVQVLQSLIDLILVLVVQMWFEFDKWLKESDSRR